MSGQAFPESAQPARHVFSPNGIQPRLAPEFVIASEGKAAEQITISPEASEGMQATAEILANFLGKMTGGEFAIQRGTEAKGITLGTLAQFPDPSLEEALKIGDWNDGKEAFTIRTTAENLRLIGASDLGARHAAYRLLELLGVRRFFAGQEWEVVPNKPDLVFDADEESRPALISRRLWMAFGRGFGEESKRWQKDHDAWAQHNRMDQSLEFSIAHMYGQVYRQNKEEFDANKETYYALLNGERERPGKFNLANPRVRELILKTSLAQMDRTDGKTVDMVSIEPSDGGNWCQSPENAALGSIPDRAFGLANDLAAKLDEIGKPEIKVGMLAYFQHSDPPSMDLDPRIAVQLATRMQSGKYDVARLKELWSEKTKNLGIYDYYSTYVWGQERMRDPGSYFPAADPEKVAADLDEYIEELGIRSIAAESLANWALFGPGYYVAVQKMWDPRSKVSALLDDFYRSAFGPAENEMRKFYEELYPSSGRRINYDTLRRFHEMIDAAAQAASRDEAVLARISRIKQYLHSNLMNQRRILETDDDKAKELALAYYTHVYRTQEAHMMAAVPILIYSAPKDPLMGIQGTKYQERPWSGQPPLTSEETEVAFREDLEFLKKQGDPVEMTRFSRDFVAVSLPGEARITGINSTNSGALTFLTTEAQTVKIPLTIRPGVHQPGVESSYRVVDHEGKILSKGTVIHDQHERQERLLEISVPGPGLYRLIFPETSNLGFLPGVNVPAAAIPEPAIGATYVNVVGLPSLFFYVPKGTTELIVHVGLTKQQELKLLDPSGQRHEVDGHFGIARVPVPDGMDGQVWQLGPGQKVDNLYFYNIPNSYSLDSRRALLPREVVETDQLPPSAPPAPGTAAVTTP